MLIVLKNKEVVYGEVNELFNKNLLLEGMGGSGKTNALIHIAKELVKDKKTICYLDFRNELLEYYEEFNGVSVKSNEAKKEKIGLGLNHIHFGEDILFQYKKYQIEFLFSIVEKMDYLLIDDAYYLTENRDCKSVSEICKMLLSENPKLKFIFTTKSRNFFQQEDKEFVLKLCSNTLKFRQHPFGLNENNQYLSVFSVGEAVYFEEDTPTKYYSFYKKTNKKNLDYINSHMKK